MIFLFQCHRLSLQEKKRHLSLRQTHADTFAILNENSPYTDKKQQYRYYVTRRIMLLLSIYSRKLSYTALSRGLVKNLFRSYKTNLRFALTSAAEIEILQTWGISSAVRRSNPNKTQAEARSRAAKESASFSVWGLLY